MKDHKIIKLYYFAIFMLDVVAMMKSKDGGKKKTMIEMGGHRLNCTTVQVRPMIGSGTLCSGEPVFDHDLQVFFCLLSLFRVVFVHAF